MMLDVLLGGITGLIGTIWSGYNQRKVKELENEDKKAERAHELAMVGAESQAMLAEAEANIKVTTAQVEGAVALEEVKAFTASQRTGNANVFLESFMERMFSAQGWVAYLAQPVGVLICLLFGLVDTLKGLARPGITAYLLGVSTWVTIQAWRVLDAQGVTLSPAQAETLLSQVIGTVLYLTVTAVTWWFGDRMTAKGMERLLKAGRGRK
jgi:hypothetical protein